MSDKPKVDPYPEPVAMSALDMKAIQRLQAQKGRDARLARLARRNRDVAWLLGEHRKTAKPEARKSKSKLP